MKAPNKLRKIMRTKLALINWSRIWTQIADCY